MTMMHTKQQVAPLVVFGEDWGAHPSSTQHLIRRFMQQRDVIWVDSLGLRRPRISDARRLGYKVQAMFRTPRDAGDPENNHADSAPVRIAPRAISWPGSSVAEWITRQLVSRQVLDGLAPLGSAKPIFWTSLPSAVSLLGSLDEVAVVYYAGDDFSALAGVDHRAVSRQEARLAKKADMIIAASEAIAARFPQHKTCVIPHGVDTDLFSKPAERAADLPVSGRPTAGFYGAIDAWVDIERLARTAIECPDWDFVFIGAVRTDVTVLSDLANVKFLGKKEHSELPRYSQHWTASLLPFRDNGQIQACNPLKLREYLAAGSPIISTRFPAAEHFSEHIHFAEDTGSFAPALHAALNEGPLARQKRMASVQKQSWEARAAEISVLLEALQNGPPTSI